MKWLEAALLKLTPGVYWLAVVTGASVAVVSLIAGWESSFISGVFCLAVGVGTVIMHGYLEDEKRAREDYAYRNGWGNRKR